MESTILFALSGEKSFFKEFKKLVDLLKHWSEVVELDFKANQEGEIHSACLVCTTSDESLTCQITFQAKGQLTGDYLTGKSPFVCVRLEDLRRSLKTPPRNSVDLTIYKKTPVIPVQYTEEEPITVTTRQTTSGFSCIKHQIQEHRDPGFVSFRERRQKRLERFEGVDLYKDREETIVGIKGSKLMEAIETICLKDSLLTTSWDPSRKIFELKNGADIEADVIPEYTNVSEDISRPVVKSSWKHSTVKPLTSIFKILKPETATFIYSGDSGDVIDITGERKGNACSFHLIVSSTHPEEKNQKKRKDVN